MHIYLQHSSVSVLRGIIFMQVTATHAVSCLDYAICLQAVPALQKAVGHVAGNISVHYLLLLVF